MPDWITGLFSIFRKEIFSVKYMLIIFLWFVGLLLTPDNVKNSFDNKITFPFSYEVFIFISSFLLCAFIFYLKNKIKLIISIHKKRKNDKNLIDMVNALGNQELDLINFLLTSGSDSVKFSAEEIPDFVFDLIRKKVIYQSSKIDLYHQCEFSLTNNASRVINQYLSKL